MSARPQNIGIKAIEVYFPSQVCGVYFLFIAYNPICQEMLTACPVC